jgi:hypothetical protein
MVEERVKVKLELDGSGFEDLRNMQAQSGIAAADANARTADTTKEEEKRNEKTNKQIGQVQSALNSAAEITSGILTETFNVIQQLYERLKKSSPLLETIETLFNLAMTLLFMPLGNALGEVILPSVIDLVDNILSMWELFDEQFNQGDLSGMLTTIFTTGVNYIGQFIESIGEKLMTQGGLLGGIGRLLNVIGEFLRGDMASVLGTLVRIGTWVIDHVKELVSLIVAFKAASFAMDITKIGLMMTQIQTTAAAGSLISGKVFGSAVGTVGIASSLATGAAVGAASGVATYGVLSSLGLAEGGYVPATDGGQLIPLGDRGEGEYVIPESKVGSMTGAQNITNNFYGYTQAELVQIVKETLRDELLSSKYTAGGL